MEADRTHIPIPMRPRAHYFIQPSRWCLMLPVAPIQLPNFLKFTRDPTPPSPQHHLVVATHWMWILHTHPPIMWMCNSAGILAMLLRAATVPLPTPISTLIQPQPLSTWSWPCKRPAVVKIRPPLPWMWVHITILHSPSILPRVVRPLQSGLPTLHRGVLIHGHGKKRMWFSLLLSRLQPLRCTTPPTTLLIRSLHSLARTAVGSAKTACNVP